MEKRSTKCISDSVVGDYVENDKLLEAKDVLPNKPHAGHRKGRKNTVLCLVTLTFDLGIATRPRKGPSTSFV